MTREKPTIKGGRHRGSCKSEEEQRHEHQAKGHKAAEVAPSERPEHKNERKDDRGRQRGFGKNQGKESDDMSTAHGTKGAGA